jgi:outer membrane protein assembly factor BamA
MRNAAFLLAAAAVAILSPPLARAGPPESGPTSAASTTVGVVPPDEETDLADPGYTLERIEIRGNHKTTNALVTSLLGLRTGAPWNERSGRLARLRLLTTGYFMTVELSLARGSRPGWVVLRVDVVERNTLLLRDLFIASSTLEPIVFGWELAETNLLGTGMYLSGAFVAGRDQAGLTLRWADPAVGSSRVGVGVSLVYVDAVDFFGTRCRTFAGTPLPPDDPTCRGADDALAGATDYARLHYRRAGGMTGLSWALARFTSVYLDLRLESLHAELPAGASTTPPRATEAEPIDFHIVEGSSLLVSAMITLETDSRDHPYLPRTGTLFSAMTELSHRYMGSSYQFVKVAAHLQHVWRVRRNDALKLDVLAGAIWGEAPFFDRFYLGDFSELVPYRNLEIAMSAHVPTLLPSSVDRMRYEDYVGKVALEYAVPVREKIGKYIYGIDFFVRPGVFAIFSADDLRGGALDGRPPLDLTLDLGFRADTFIGDFSLSLGNVIGIVPF